MAEKEVGQTHFRLLPGGGLHRMCRPLVTMSNRGFPTRGDKNRYFYEKAAVDDEWRLYTQPSPWNSHWFSMDFDGFRLSSGIRSRRRAMFRCDECHPGRGDGDILTPEG